MTCKSVHTAWVAGAIILSARQGCRADAEPCMPPLPLAQVAPANETIVLDGRMDEPTWRET